MAKASTESKTKTYILDLRGGNSRRITIPSTWKLTFGHIVPPMRNGTAVGHSYEDATGSRVALRIYEGAKENLRAVMTDVVGLRDASIQIVEKRTTVKQQAAVKQTKHGQKNVTVEARMTEWVNPDAEGSDDVPNEFLTITDETEG